MSTGSITRKRAASPQAVSYYITNSSERSKVSYVPGYVLGSFKTYHSDKEDHIIVFKLITKPYCIILSVESSQQ
jgi:hypothetical protein